MTWVKERKTSLTPEEVLKVAYQHLILCIDQHTLAEIYGGVNQARVNEAIVVIKESSENHMEIYRARNKGEKDVK